MKKIKKYRITSKYNSYGYTSHFIRGKIVNLAQREEQSFFLYLTGSAQRGSVCEKLLWIGTEPKD